MMREVTRSRSAPTTAFAARILSHAGLRPGIYMIADCDLSAVVDDEVCLPSAYTLTPSSACEPFSLRGAGYVGTAGARWNGRVLAAIEDEHGTCTWQPSEPINFGGAWGMQPMLIGRGTSGRMVALVCPMV